MPEETQEPLPPLSEPPQPQKAAVLVAAFMPVIAIALFLMVAAGILLVAMRVYRGMNKQSVTPVTAVVAPTVIEPTVAAPPVAPPPVVSMPAQPISPVAVVTPTPPLMPEMPTTAPTAAAPAPVQIPPPSVDDFTPQIVHPGSKLVIRGQELATVNRVLLVSSQGASVAEAKINLTRDKLVIVTVPDVPFANDAIFLVIMSPGGVSIMVDQHMGNTPWGTDGHLHDTAVNVRPGDEIDTLDNMIVTAQEGSSISVGNHSMVFLDKDVTVKSHGKDCHIYYVAPVELGPGVSRTGMVEVSAVQVNASMDAFRVKLPPPGADQ